VIKQGRKAVLVGPVGTRLETLFKDIIGNTASTSQTRVILLRVYSRIGSTTHDTGTSAITVEDTSFVAVEAQVTQIHFK